MQKGWRIVTSHARLAEVMHKPCSCPTNYKHAKCEGKNATASARYTKEYVRLAVDALSREGDFQRVVEECSGKSQLPSRFGLGLMCTCSESKETCGSCLLDDSAMECQQEQSQAYMSMQENQTLNQQARELQQKPQNLTLQELEHFLQHHPLTNLGKTRRNSEAPQAYQGFGSYAFGNQYGLTGRRTRRCAELCRYINRVLERVMPKDMHWTSFALNHGTMMPIHKDYNNDAQYPNGSVGFGQYTGGGLWIEGSEVQGGNEGKVSVRENAHGEILEGREYGIRLNPVVFSPKLRHGSCKWEGDRWVLTVFVSRNWQCLTQEELQELGELDFPVPQESSQAAYPAEQRPEGPKHPKNIERIKKQLYLLHCATGHSNPRHMEQALKKRGADAQTLQLAKDFSCPVCSETSKPQPRNLAALEPLPPKLATISADVGHWVHPHTHESVKFMLVIDEGSRFRTARILSQASRQSPNAQMCLHYLQEGWVQYFGLPRCLRLDPAGVFRSTAVEDWCDKHGIFLDIVPGEAHWKVGTCENAVQGVKNVMDKLSHLEEKISEPNTLDIVLATTTAPESLSSTGGPRRQTNDAGNLEESMADSSGQPEYWQLRPGPTSPGEVRAGGAVWLVKGRSLLKASPEQLRRATEREEMLEALSEPSSQSTPWTLHTVAEKAGGRDPANQVSTAEEAACTGSHPRRGGRGD